MMHRQGETMVLKFSTYDSKSLPSIFLQIWYRHPAATFSTPGSFRRVLRPRNLGDVSLSICGYGVLLCLTIVIGEREATESGVL